jgi:Na+/H+ antiporter NhaD/arsenite permease-like protein
MRHVALTAAFVLLASVLLAGPALAAGADAPHLDGAGLSVLWVVPFAGMLLSIAIMPLALPAFWHHHYGKVAAFWGLAFFAPFLATFGFSLALYEFLHVTLLEYLPFIILLFALFTVAGGVRLRGTLVGTPALNTAILLFGTIIASVMGTTGASMLLIRPMLAANAWRRSQVHVVVFFIFLVSNIGGSLTPLGDPPLFLGFLKGVSFFWTLQHIWMDMLFCTVVLLVLFFALDTWFYRRETARPPARSPEPLAVEGKINILLLGGVLGAVLMSGTWQAGTAFTLYHIDVPLAGLVRDILLVGLAFLSLWLTSNDSRLANGFSWGPILEVAKLFAGIFATIIPAIAILRAGDQGALAAIVKLASNADGTPNNAMYFWLTGGLSSFLDNAPTYLVFFNLAGGDPQVLMTTMANTLAAVSAGAVFMGANTYIGNAPNFMVKAIAEDRGVKMPSFFGYMAWSGAILIPLFLVTTLLFFRN